MSGTSAALFAAAAHPERIASAIVGSGGTAAPIQLGEPLASWALDPDLDTYRKMGPRAIVGAALDTIADGIPADIRADYLACYDGDRFAKSMRYVRRYPEELPVLAGLLPQITVPVTIISGRHDLRRPARQRGVSRRAAARQPPCDHRWRALLLGGGASEVRLGCPRLDYGQLAFTQYKPGVPTTVDSRAPKNSPSKSTSERSSSHDHRRCASQTEQIICAPPPLGSVSKHGLNIRRSRTYLRLPASPALLADCDVL